MDSYDVAVVGLGALGSAATLQLARRGASVVGLDQFELGHVRGASHDTSRIVRTSYGESRYVRLAQSAYRDWADLEQEVGERLLTTTGGIVSIPAGSPYSMAGFVSSLTECGVPHELLAPDEVRARWPQLTLGDDVETIHTPDTAIAHASRTVALLQAGARHRGAHLRDRTPVTGLSPEGDGVVVHTGRGDLRARRVVLAADAWTGRLLAPLDSAIPLVTMQEQVTYFAPAEPARFDPSRFPVWIWEDTRCYYGFPTFGEPTIKAARDVSDNLMTPEERTFAPSAELVEELSDFVRSRIPDAGPALRTVTCQYALTPDREFVLGPLARHPEIVVALTAGHGFKFTPAIGRILAELALDGGTDDDIAGFAVPQPAAARA